MRRVEVMILDPERCESAKSDILVGLTQLHDIMIGGKVIDVVYFLRHFTVLWRLSLDELREHFDEKELEVIIIYREWDAALTQRGDISEAAELQTKLNEISEFATLFSIMRKSIKLELPLRCLGDIKYVFLITRELEKIDNYLRKLKNKEIEYETAQKEIGKCLNQICKKIKNMIEILWR